MSYYEEEEEEELTTSFNGVFTAKSTNTICFSKCFIFNQIMVKLYRGQRIAPKIWNDPARFSVQQDKFAREACFFSTGQLCNVMIF